MGTFYHQTDPVITQAVTAVFDQGQQLQTQEERAAFIYSLVCSALDVLRKARGDDHVRLFLSEYQATCMKTEASTSH